MDQNIGSRLAKKKRNIHTNTRFQILETVGGWHTDGLTANKKETCKHALNVMAVRSGQFR